MATSAQELRMEIDERRAAIDQDLADLGQAASPSTMASQVASAAAGGVANTVKEKVGSMRDSVMGSASSAGSSVAGTAGSAKDRVRRAPTAVAQRTAGNPLGAGLAAFGLGLVAAAMWPSTDRERRLVQKVEEQAGPAVKELAQAEAGAVAQELKAPAAEAAQTLKDRATEAADSVKEQAAAAAPGSSSSNRGSSTDGPDRGDLPVTPGA